MGKRKKQKMEVTMIRNITVQKIVFQGDRNYFFLLFSFLVIETPTYRLFLWFGLFTGLFLRMSKCFN